MSHKDENPLIPYDKTANELEYLLGLTKQIREKEQRYPINFNDFLFLLSTNPKQVLRNIFQLFHDMVHYYVPEGTDEYENDSENVGFSFYDLSKLLVENVEAYLFLVIDCLLIDLCKWLKKSIKVSM